MRPKKLKKKYRSKDQTPNPPKQKEKFLSEIRTKRQPNQTLQPNLRAQINPTSEMMTIQSAMPLTMMESTFQGLESDQKLSLTGLLPGLPNIADKKGRLQPKASYGARDERTAAR